MSMYSTSLNVSKRRLALNAFASGACVHLYVYTYRQAHTHTHTTPFAVQIKSLLTYWCAHIHAREEGGAVVHLIADVKYYEMLIERIKITSPLALI